MDVYKVCLILSALYTVNCGLENGGAYIDELSRNIEKSGLLLGKDFQEAWKEHMQLWNSFRQDSEEEQGPLNNTFICNTTKTSNDSARTIHQLTPWDIAIVGALGDSFMAASGADAKSIRQMNLQYRGLSFAIGGDGNASTIETLPNFLKAYNSEIKGWSRSISPVWFKELSQLNVAAPGATAKGLDNQAREIIKRINRISGATEKWKHISIFIGINDLCQECELRFGQRQSNFGRRVKRALDRLRDELTRTLVSLIALPPIFSWYRQLHNDTMCYILHRYNCPCIMQPNVDDLAQQYNSQLYKLASTYDRSDFTVVVQPLFAGMIEFPAVLVDGVNQTDQSYFAPDCFHPSRKGHAVAARALWTNLFQAIDEKMDKLNFTGEILCPDEARPYIRTRENSINCTAPTRTTVNCSGMMSIMNCTSGMHCNGTMAEMVNCTDMMQMMNSTHHPQHHPNNTNTSSTGAPFTLLPWDIIPPHKRAMIPQYNQPHQLAQTGPVSLAAWIVMGLILGLAWLSCVLIGFGLGNVIQTVGRMRRQRRRRVVNERTPLVKRGISEQMF